MGFATVMPPLSGDSRTGKLGCGHGDANVDLLVLSHFPDTLLSSCWERRHLPVCVLGWELSEMLARQRPAQLDSVCFTAALRWAGGDLGLCRLLPQVPTTSVQLHLFSRRCLPVAAAKSWGDVRCTTSASPASLTGAAAARLTPLSTPNEVVLLLPSLCPDRPAFQDSPVSLVESSLQGKGS